MRGGGIAGAAVEREVERWGGGEVERWRGGEVPAARGHGVLAPRRRLARRGSCVGTHPVDKDMR